jgi:aldose 1-epimerase
MKTMGQAPATPLIHLSAGDWHAEISAAVGGAIARFWADGRDGAANGRVDWLRPATDGALAACDPLAMGSFPLLPFCNRIRDGRASFGGREIRFPKNHPSDPASPHPLHGIAWLLPWRVVGSDARHAELSLQVDASEAWPWRFSARQRYRIDDAGVEVMMTLTNEDDAPMPAGIGHHPYFPHTPGTRLTSPTAAMWEADAEVMPTRLETQGAVTRLREGVVLSELALDNNFIGWEREALVEWPADRQGTARSLVMEADPPLDYFVLYCPRGYDHFCAEPVSQCTDWLNLLERYGHEPLGGTTLQPSETLAASFRLIPRWT